MTAKRTVFVIPGYKHTPQNKAYKKLAKILRKEGYYPILVKIPWKNTTISENASYFLKKYKALRRKRKYILGFSFGAMIAFLASTKVSPSGLILCSLSPYFKEDGVASALRCKTLAQKTKARKILMLYGEKEEKVLIKRVQKAYRQIPKKRKQLIRIQKAEHDLGSGRYLQTIHQVASQLY